VKDVSVGFEFEFDIIAGRTGNLYYSGRCRCYPSNGFIEQVGDGTAAEEIITRPATSLKHIGEEIGKYWRDTLKRRSVPVLKGKAYNYSLGLHIHVGLLDRSLTADEKYRIAKNIKYFLPLLQAINTNDYRFNWESYRQYNSSYCFTLIDKVISTDHYAEISSSTHGTVEVRKFDAHIPQVALTLAWFLKILAKGALNGKVVKNLDFKNICREQNSASKEAVGGISIEGYLSEFMNTFGDEIEEEEDLKVVKEVVGLALSDYAISQILRRFHVYGNLKAEKEFFRRALRNPLELRALIPIATVVGWVNWDYSPQISFPRDPVVRAIKIRRLLSLGKTPKEVMDLMTQSGYNDRRAHREVKSVVKLMGSTDVKSAKEELYRYYIKEYPSREIDFLRAFNLPRPFTLEDVKIVRIAELTSEQKAQLEELQRYGDSKPIGFNEIYHRPERFYVAIWNNKVIGCISGHVKCTCYPGLISRLIVHPEFRRCGVSMKLGKFIRNIIRAENRHPWCKIRTSNEAARNRIRKVGEYSYRGIRELNGDLFEIWEVRD